MKRRLPEGDDGRTVADMNVEGMPGFTPPSAPSHDENGPAPAETMTKKETRVLMLNAVVAALAVGGVFVLLGALVILFCTNCWLA